MNKPGNGHKILVVDDNPRNIQVIGTILREAEYEVGFALDGKQALDLLHDSENYDLVLLDIKMPGLDGYEVCRIMKNDDRYKEIPIIFLSASHELENIIAAFNAGGVDYVTKPFNTQELLARVNTHLQLKQKTREVEDYARELEKVNATKDKFFSIIAHDLKNPFEGILLITRALLSRLSNISTDEIRRQITMIVSATDSGNKLLENLLIWSRSQTGVIDYRPGTVSLEPAIRQCIELINATANAKNIRILFTPDLKMIIRADESMFSHILRNLLTNAIKFTEPGGTVTIGVEKIPGAVRISVTDTGLGITEKDKARLFRIDGEIASRPGTSNETGSGLGLILCKEFVDKMGGTISVESKLGKGSRFAFTLPAA